MPFDKGRFRLSMGIISLNLDEWLEPDEYYYRELLEKAIDYYFSEEEQIKYFGTKPKSRYDTFKYCHSYSKKQVSIQLMIRS